MTGSPAKVSTQDTWVTTADGRLFVRQWRPDDAARTALAPIVLFHESLGAVSLWRDLPETLARATGRVVLAYDRLGFGRSDPHPGRLALDFITEEARGGFRALREQLSIDAFVAYGHSTGGSMAAACAAAHPHGCRALVTESAHAFVEARTLDGVRRVGRELVRPARFERLRRHHGDKVFWVLDAWVNTWLAPAFATWSLADELPKIVCPTLVVHGDADPFGSLAHPAYMAARIQGAIDVVTLRDVGHVPHRERAAAFVEAVVGRLAASD